MHLQSCPLLGSSGCAKSTCSGQTNTDKYEKSSEDADLGLEPSWVGKTGARATIEGMGAPSGYERVVAEAQERGEEDFVRALARVGSEELTAAWDEAVRRSKDDQYERLQGLDAERREQVIGLALERWRESGRSEGATAGAAATLKLVLASRPPFTNGNLAALKSGAQSPRRIEKLVPSMEQHVQEAIESERGRVTPGDWIIGRRLARTLAQLQLVDRYEDELGGPLDGRGRERPHTGRADRYENRLLKQAWALGLGRMAEARIYEAISGSGRHDAGDWRAAQARIRARLSEGDES